MPRFVLLHHDYPHPHWDLLLEAGAMLRSWRLARPLDHPGVIPAEPTPDHRLLYLDYEGPVHGKRGTVIRHDAGTFRWIADEPDRVVVELQGERCCGLAVVESDGTTTRLDWRPSSP